MPKRCGLPSVLLLVTAAGLIGCGGAGKPVKVQGVVTLDGKELAGATVSFWPTGEGKGRMANGRTEANGSFNLTTFQTGDGALPGEYKVTVTYVEENKGVENVDPMTMDDKAKRAMFMKMSPEGRAKSDKAQKKSKVVPAVYTEFTKTPLKEVVPPPGKVELNLSTGAR